MEEEAERMNLMLKMKSVYGGGVAEFSKENADLFEGSGYHQFLFRASERQQIVLHIIQSPIKYHGAGIDVARCKKKGTIAHFFPLHDKKLKSRLSKIWVHGWTWNPLTWLEQPLNSVREYFGEKIGLYFAWLGFYTKALVLPALVGLLLFVAGISSGDPDNKAVPVFALFMALWATFFLEFWKRRQATLSLRWGMTDFEEKEEQRPEFIGEERPSPVTGKLETYFNPLKRNIRRGLGSGAIGGMIGVVIVAVISIFTLRIVLVRAIDSTIGGILVGIVNAIQIELLNIVYQWLAEKLNDWENHRTETDYEDNLIAKVFCFQFINNFNSLFYVAFFKAHATLFGGEKDECKGSCLSELSVQLGSIFITRMVIGNTIEVGIPLLKRKLLTRRAVSQAKKQKGVDAQALTEGVKEELLTPAELQAKQPVYESTFADYAEMIIQFGFVTMFVSAFPLAPFLALLNNLIEIRSDGFKLCAAHQRPVAKGAEDIGTWYNILEIMSTAAVITNAGIVAFTSDVFEEKSFRFRIWLFIFAEHIIVGLKFVVALIVPDIPEAVKIEYERQLYLKEKIMNGEESDLDEGGPPKVAQYDGEDDIDTYSDNYEDPYEQADM
eukprot:TRINITY_DN2533_c1_g1_i1.p1 TRINITY_DN2533_c1_g1~~TRINITY_DN2533_c1_g1_i1.p1  ORF type:complete len:713 (-),score=171.93 TRINITY_DN2533_c1_g1_i1:46-1872(-)